MGATVVLVIIESWGGAFGGIRGGRPLLVFK